MMLLRVKGAAELAGVSTQRIRAAIEQGHLKPAEGVPYICLKEDDVIAFRDRDKSKGGRGKKIKAISETTKKHID